MAELHVIAREGELHPKVAEIVRKYAEERGILAEELKEKSEVEIGKWPILFWKEDIFEGPKVNPLPVGEGFEKTVPLEGNPVLEKLKKMAEDEGVKLEEMFYLPKIIEAAKKVKEEHGEDTAVKALSQLIGTHPEFSKLMLKVEPLEEWHVKGLDRLNLRATRLDYHVGNLLNPELAKQVKNLVSILSSLAEYKRSVAYEAKSEEERKYHRQEAIRLEEEIKELERLGSQLEDVLGERATSIHDPEAPKKIEKVLPLLKELYERSESLFQKIKDDAHMYYTLQLRKILDTMKGILFFDEPTAKYFKDYPEEMKRLEEYLQASGEELQEALSPENGWKAEEVAEALEAIKEADKTFTLKPVLELMRRGKREAVRAAIAYIKLVRAAYLGKEAVERTRGMKLQLPEGEDPFEHGKVLHERLKKEGLEKTVKFEIHP